MIQASKYSFSQSSPDLHQFEEEPVKRSASEKYLPLSGKACVNERHGVGGERRLWARSDGRRQDLPIATMREPVLSSSRKDWRHVTIAFMLGAMFSYTCLIFSIHVGHPSLGLMTEFDQESPWGPEAAVWDWDCPKPKNVGLSPNALASLTGNPMATPDKLIVAARHSDDTSWLDVYLSDIPHVVYQVDDPHDTIGAQHVTLANKGNEAMCYLQFIVDYYDRLPDTIVFLHGHRGTWHMRDHVPLLQRLRWGNLPFANLRYANAPGNRLDWECGNKTELEEFKSFDCNWQGSHLKPRNPRPRKEWELNVGNKDVWWDSVELREVWSELYEAEMGEIPENLAAPCCAEFMVVKERILAHDRDFYIHMRDWILETELGRYRSGRVFEYMWHVIFGEPHVIEAVPECELLHCNYEMSNAQLR